jgi:hypothetical protein
VQRTYALTLPTDRTAATVNGSLSVQPGVVIQRDFEFEADALNLREVEVVGTFEAAQGTDRGPTGFWFWAYASGPRGRSPSSRAGLSTIGGLAAPADGRAGQTVTVRGQFRGRNLFRDLDPNGAPPDGWVIKDGQYALWVFGRKPKGSGWQLDLDNRGDTAKWVQVTGRLERKGDVTRLKATYVALVAVPPAAIEP